MTEIRVLSVRNPWLWAILHAGKDIENRGHNIAGSYRGLVALHAPLREAVVDDTDPTPLNAARARLQHDRGSIRLLQARGAIVGVVDLVDVHVGGWSALQSPMCFELDSTGLADCDSPWGELDAYHMVLANPRTLRTPIPYRGALGLRRLDAATTALIHQEIQPA